VDLIFAKVKPRGARRIGFADFLNALDIVAAIKFGADPDGPAAVRSSVVYAGGPMLDNVHLPATGGVFEKLTDSAQFTGVSKGRFDDAGNGLGSSYRDDSDGYADLSDVTRPDFRGGTTLASASATRRAGTVHAGGPSSPASPSAALSSSRRRAGEGISSASAVGSPGGGAYEGGRSSAAAPAVPRVVIESTELHSIFLSYAAFGSTSRALDSLDGGKFSKLAREAGIVSPSGSGVTSAAVDLAFSRVKLKGTRTINYDEFQQALAILAPQRFPTLDIVGALQSTVELIIVAGGPAFRTASIPVIDGVYEHLTATGMGSPRL